jgi:hypothetical protein
MIDTNIAAIGGGTTIRDSRTGRFVGVNRNGDPVAGQGFRIIGGRLFTVTVLPDAPKPRWACKSRPVGKSQHGKRGGYREGSREVWAHRATRLATSPTVVI